MIILIAAAVIAFAIVIAFATVIAFAIVIAFATVIAFAIVIAVQRRRAARQAFEAFPDLCYADKLRCRYHNAEALVKYAAAKLDAAEHRFRWYGLEYRPAGSKKLWMRLDKSRLVIRCETGADLEFFDELLSTGRFARRQFDTV